MKTKNIALLLIVIVAISLVSVACASAYLPKTTYEHQPIYHSYYCPLGLESNYSTGTLNTTQGATQQINYTIQGWYPVYWPSSELDIKIQNLTVLSYNSLDSDLTTWSNWDSSVPQESAFTYNFDQTEITLEKYQSKSFIITLHWAENAPTGRYIISLNSTSPALALIQPEDEPFMVDIWVYVYPKA